MRGRAWRCQYVVGRLVGVIMKVVVLAKVVREGSRVAIVAGRREGLCGLTCGAIALIFLFHGSLMVGQG